MARPLGGNHHYVHVRGRHNQLKTNVEAVGKAEHLARGEVGRHGGFIDLLLHLVRQQQHDPVRPGCRLLHRRHLQAIRPGFDGGAAPLVEADNHLHPAVPEIEGMGMALGAIADDGHRLCVQDREVSVVVVKKVGHRKGTGPQWRIANFKQFQAKTSWQRICITLRMVRLSRMLRPLISARRMRKLTSSWLISPSLATILQATAKAVSC